MMRAAQAQAAMGAARSGGEVPEDVARAVDERARQDAMAAVGQAGMSV